MEYQNTHESEVIKCSNYESAVNMKVKCNKHESAVDKKVQ